MYSVWSCVCVCVCVCVLGCSIQLSRVSISCCITGVDPFDRKDNEEICQEHWTFGAIIVPADVPIPQWEASYSGIVQGQLRDTSVCSCRGHACITCYCHFYCIGFVFNGTRPQRLGRHEFQFVDPEAESEDIEDMFPDAQVSNMSLLRFLCTFHSPSFNSYSVPIHLLFTSCSPPVHLPFPSHWPPIHRLLFLSMFSVFSFFGHCSLFNSPSVIAFRCDSLPMPVVVTAPTILFRTAMAVLVAMPNKTRPFLSLMISSEAAYFQYCLELMSAICIYSESWRALMYSFFGLIQITDGF